MQEQPITRTEFNELKEEVRQLREQQTEEIKITVDRPSKEVLKRLDQLEKDLDKRSELWLDTLQQNYDELKSTMATKDDLKAMEERMVDVIRKYSQPGKN